MRNLRTKHSVGMLKGNTFSLLLVITSFCTSVR
jgi:hypothetical protein